MLLLLVVFVPLASLGGVRTSENEKRDQTPKAPVFEIPADQAEQPHPTLEP
jgi:hypothetical protein